MYEGLGNVYIRIRDQIDHPSLPEALLGIMSHITCTIICWKGTK